MIYLGAGEKILIVDDDPAILETLGTKLRAAGYTILTAKNGLEAVKISRSELPSLIILDLLMPIMGGAGAVIKLKEDESTRNIPIFFLTGVDLTHEEIRQETVGVDVIFHKPFSFKDLIDKIAEVLGKSR